MSLDYGKRFGLIVHTIIITQWNHLEFRVNPAAFNNQIIKQKLYIPSVWISDGQNGASIHNVEVHDALCVLQFSLR